MCRRHGGCDPSVIGDEGGERARCRTAPGCAQKRYGASRPVTAGRVAGPVGSRPAAIVAGVCRAVGTQHIVGRLRRLHDLRLSSLCHLARYGFIVARWSPPSLTYPRRGPPCHYFFKQRRDRARGGTSLVISRPVGSRPAAINCRSGREASARGLRCNRDRSCRKTTLIGW